MSRRLLEEYEIDMFNQTIEGQLYLKYNQITGGDVLGLRMPDGYPVDVSKYGDVSGVYRECIKRKVTWEDLFGYVEKDDPTVIY